MTTDKIIDAPPSASPADNADPAVVATPPADAATSPLVNTPPVDKPVAVQADWPADWKEKYAGEDQDKIKRLGRYASPKDALDALFEAQKKISSGEYKKVTAAPKDEAALAEWRKEVGVPETPDKYDTTLADGLVIGETDKPYVDKFLQGVHAHNFTQEQAKAALGVYFKMQEEAQAEIQQIDKQVKAESEDTLRQEWGPEYRANMNELSNFLNTRFKEEIGADLMEARLPDGTRLGDNAKMLGTLLSMAREINPSATIVPNASEPGKAINDELKALQAKMGTREWYNSPADQTRYMQLLQAKERYK